MQGSDVPALEAAAPGAANRIEYIDGLRALAVLAVIVHHVVVQHWHTQSVASIANEGAHGVDLFFVLSGFCLAYPTFAKLQRAGTTIFDLAAFGAKRLVRIIPPFYIATGLLVIVLIVIPALRHPGRTIPFSFQDVVAPLFFLDGDANLLNGSFWTLMVEFRWYFAFPVLLAVWLSSRRAFFLLGALLAILYHFTRARGLDLGTLPGFMLGIVAADLQAGSFRTNRWGVLARKWSLPLGALCALIGVACEPFAQIPHLAYDADVHFAYQPTVLGWQLAMFFLVVAAGEHHLLRRALSVRIMIATGVASYGIYLVHQPVVEIVEGNVAGPLGIVGALILAPLVGFAFWFLAERPFTTGPLRNPLVSWSTRQFERGLRLLHLDRSLRLSTPSTLPVALALAEGHSAPMAQAIAPSS